MKARWLLGLLLLACGGPPPELLPLTPGATLHREVAGGRIHRFRFQAPANRFLHLDVEQRGVDVIVLLNDASGRLVYEVDGPGGVKDVETVMIVTPAAPEGDYLLTVEPVSPEGDGAFDLIVRSVRPASPEDRLRAAAAAAYARGDRRRRGGDFERAVPAYREALPPLETLGDRPQAAKARWHLGESLFETGKLLEADRLLKEAAAGFRELGDRLGEARALNDVGTVARLLGDPGRSIQAHQDSLRLYRELGNEMGEGASLNNLALAMDQSGDLQGAIERYEEALLLARRLGNRLGESKALQNLGNLNILIGHDDEGMDLLQQGLKLVEEGRESDRASALLFVGWAHYLAGRPNKALPLLVESAALARKAGDRQAEAGAWDRRGSVLRSLRRYAEAEAAYTRGLDISRALGSPVNQGNSLANLGWLDLETGNAKRARDRLREAVKLLEASGDPNGETFARIGLSRAERRLGAYGPARQEIDAAIRLIEDLRSGLTGARSRGSFLATRYEGYEDLVSLLMELHRREPGKGYDREALEAVERARARNLAEGMSEAIANTGTEPQDIAARRRALRAEISSIEQRRLGLAQGSPRDPRLQTLDADLRARGLELDRLSAVDARQPAAATLTAGRIQALADDGTVLVVYLLADPVSFAWTVDRDRIEPHLLPGRERIEILARRVVAGLSNSGLASQNAAARAARELSDAVLGPLRERLAGRKRLVILADGALHLVPFAALPEPGGGEAQGVTEPLLVRHEISLLPSATFLDRQRRELADRRPAPGAVAMIASPVFGLDDKRLSQDRREGGAPPPRAFEPAGPFRHLPYTEQEAREILRLVQGETLVALGTDARRDLVLSGALSRFRMLHFATHGLLHPVLPERSGLVLSLYDEQGRRQDGFLSAPDVAGLSLPAELAVLSACETGLGRELRGEGLVGLTQAFFQAGTRRVIVSHWPVQDRATAELMARLYQGLLVDRLPPAAALRAAQLAIRSQPQWRSPYYWASFSLQGDWR